MAMRVGLVAAIMATSLAAAAPSAHADDSEDFLALVAEQGLNVGDTSTDVQFTLSRGMRICHILYYGFSEQEAGLMVPYQFPGATPQQVAGFVDAAQATLCPRAFTIPLQPGGPS